MTERLYDDPDLVDFYDLDNGWGADLEFCAGLARDAASVLDLGCGTGVFGAAIAAGREVVGVDPAAAMLDVARCRPGGEAATWVVGDARTVRLGRRFDLVVLTGHAFQVFLTAEDRAAVLATIACHLAPDGRFVFDTRNPSVEEWREWTPAESRRVVDHPVHGRVEGWNDVSYDAATGIARYDTFYDLAGGRRLHAEARIAFIDQETLAAEITAAGLVVERWLGGWDGRPIAATAPEIIPIGRLAD